MQIHSGTSISLLIAGDAVVLAIFTLVGFASHGELSGAGVRLLTTYVPLCLAWALVAPWLGLFNLDTVNNPRALWRVLLAALIAAPMAGWLRGLALNSPIIPLFIVIMASMTAVMMLIWRGFWLLIRKRQVQHG